MRRALKAHRAKYSSVFGTTVQQPDSSRPHSRKLALGVRTNLICFNHVFFVALIVGRCPIFPNVGTSSTVDWIVKATRLGGLAQIAWSPNLGPNRKACDRISAGRSDRE